jgi:hypothetical protein
MCIALNIDEFWERETQLGEKICAEDATNDYIAAYKAEAELEILRDVINMQIEEIIQTEDWAMQSNFYLDHTDIFELAEALLALLARDLEWGEPEDAERFYWLQQRAALALWAIVDCTPEQANFYVEAAMFGDVE